MIYYRWKRDTNGKIVQKAGKNILEFVSIERVDLGQWAIPGVSKSDSSFAVFS